MSAFFFGPPGRQLFGYLHLPPAEPKAAAVLCAPWASEYQYAHRALHFLAQRLADAGCSVLRFDYSGTGDSWGHSVEADLDRWVGEVKDAVAELRAASGAGSVDLVGLRLGAFVAARAANEIPSVGSVVLWDPITDGEQWLREQGVGSDGFDGFEGREIEVADSIVPDRFIQQLRAVRAEAFSIPSARRVLLLLTQPGASARCVPTGARLETVIVEQPAPWVEDQSIWTGQIPILAVGRIAEWLT